MDNLLDRVINQFDTLISFLAISHSDVFDLINRGKQVWLSQSQVSTFPDSYSVYKIQITHSAFLLGYSYFESFLADLVRQIYLSKPEMLPKEKQLKYSEILKSNNYEAIIELMVEKEIIDLFYKRMDAVIDYFRQKLRIEWLDKYKDETIISSYVRNCIIHNLNKVDSRLAQISGYNQGDIIELNPIDVHSFGLKARYLVRYLFQQAQKRYFNKNKG